MSNTIYSDQIKVNCPLVCDENGYYHLIYKIVNTINSKIYIGKHSTKNPYDRYMGSGLGIGRAIKKYGIENFTKEILYCFTDEKEAYLKEEELVNLEFVKNENTYNIAVGGNTVAGSWSGKNAPWYGKHHTQKTKDKISKANFGEKNPMYGRKHTKETREKLSKMAKERCGEKNSMYGKHLSQEARDKISKANKGKLAGEKNPMYGKRGENCPNFGRNHTQEAKDKMSKAHTGKHHTQEAKNKMSKIAKGKYANGNNPRAKAVLKLDEFDNIITEYGTVKECCEQEHISKNKLYKIMKEHILYNGFYFKYKSKVNM